MGVLYLLRMSTIPAGIRWRRRKLTTLPTQSSPVPALPPTGFSTPADFYGLFIGKEKPSDAVEEQKVARKTS